MCGCYFFNTSIIFNFRLCNKTRYAEIEGISNETKLLNNKGGVGTYGIVGNHWRYKVGLNERNTTVPYHTFISDFRFA